MKFDFNKYPGKYVMRCKTEEEAKEFCEVMHEAGRNWYSETSYLKYTNWGVCKGETVYYFNEGMCGHIHGVQDYTILEWSDFRKEKEMTKSELKTGMVVECRIGDKCMVLLDTPKGDILLQEDVWLCMGNYKDDMRNTIDGDFDIIAVYEPQRYVCEMLRRNWNDQKCIWRRSEVKEVKEVKEVTLSEIAEKFGVDVEDIRIKEE